MKDILPSFAVAVIMLAAVLAVGQLPFAPILVMIIQIVTGVVVYFAISAITRMKPFMMVLGMAKGFLKKGK